MIQSYTHPFDAFRKELCNLALRLGSTERKLKTQGDYFVSTVRNEEHNNYVIKARDNASVYWLMTSDKLGAVAEVAVLIPVKFAPKSLQKKVYYSSISKVVDRSSVANLLKSYRDSGIEIQPLPSRKMHAKCLAWDHDNVVISSLNWMSKDATRGHQASELGLSVCGPGIADLLQVAIENEAHDGTHSKPSSRRS